MGTGMVVEEAFIDVFCDLMYGGGWMGIEREDVDGECNRAPVSAAILGTCDDCPNVFCHCRSSSSPFH